jgi:hypothetical protein
MPVDVPQAAQGQPQLRQLLTEYRARRTAHIALRAKSKYHAPGNGAPGQTYCDAAENQDIGVAQVYMMKFLTKEDKSAVRMTADTVPRDSEEYLPAVWRAICTLYSVVGPAEKLKAERDLLIYDYRDRADKLKKGDMKTFLDKTLELRNITLAMETAMTHNEFLIHVTSQIGQTLEYKTEYNNIFERLHQNPPDATVTWMFIRQKMIRAEEMRLASKSRAKHDSDDSDKQSEDETEESAQAAWHRGDDARGKGRGKGRGGGKGGFKARGGFPGGAARAGNECYDFRDTGKCRFGDSCRFEHGGTPAGGARCTRCGGKGHEVGVCPSAP